MGKNGGKGAVKALKIFYSLGSGAFTDTKEIGDKRKLWPVWGGSKENTI